MKRIVAVLAILVVMFLGGCQFLGKVADNLKNADYEVCYAHPQYGEVCIKLNGKDYVQKEALPPSLAQAATDHIELLKKADPPK